MDTSITLVGNMWLATMVAAGVIVAQQWFRRGAKREALVWVNEQHMRRQP